MITVEVVLKNGTLRPGILIRHSRNSDHAYNECTGDIQVFVLPDEVKDLVGEREETKSGIFLYNVPITFSPHYIYWDELEPGEAGCRKDLYP